MLGVSNGVTNDILKEDFQDTTSLFVDESRNTFDTSTAGKTTDGLWQLGVRVQIGKATVGRLTGLVIP